MNINQGSRKIVTKREREREREKGGGEKDC
jgi:hypothetical protein